MLPWDSSENWHTKVTKKSASSVPGSQAGKHRREVASAHVAAGGVSHTQALPPLIQLAGDQAAVESTR